MKLTTGILFAALVAGTAWAQNPDIIDNTRSTMKAVQQKKEMDSNAALAASQGQAANPAASPSQKNAAKPAAPKAKVSRAESAPSPSRSAQSPAKTTPVSPFSSPAKSALKTAAPKVKPTAASKKSQSKQKIAVADRKRPAEAKKDATKTVINLTGRRDPFISPVVSRSMLGSGCSAGKKCLSIGQIDLKGVVKSDAGMIAVVVNALNKAYFLRENDPVFNGYVVKITGDSIVFKETVQDRLGKPFTREVTKKITTPAV
jgi:hypothetical protein